MGRETGGSSGSRHKAPKRDVVVEIGSQMTERKPRNNYVNEPDPEEYDPLVNQEVAMVALTEDDLMAAADPVLYFEKRQDLTIEDTLFVELPNGEKVEKIDISREMLTIFPLTTVTREDLVEGALKEKIRLPPVLNYLLRRWTEWPAVKRRNDHIFSQESSMSFLGVLFHMAFKPRVLESALEAEQANMASEGNVKPRSMDTETFEVARPKNMIRILHVENSDLTWKEWFMMYATLLFFMPIHGCAALVFGLSMRHAFYATVMWFMFGMLTSYGIIYSGDKLVESPAFAFVLMDKSKIAEKEQTMRFAWFGGMIFCAAIWMWLYFFPIFMPQVFGMENPLGLSYTFDGEPWKTRFDNTGYPKSYAMAFGLVSVLGLIDLSGGMALIFGWIISQNHFNAGVIKGYFTALNDIFVRINALKEEIDRFKEHGKPFETLENIMDGYERHGDVVQREVESYAMHARRSVSYVNGAVLFIVFAFGCLVMTSFILVLLDAAGGDSDTAEMKRLNVVFLCFLLVWWVVALNKVWGWLTAKFHVIETCRRQNLLSMTFTGARRLYFDNPDDFSSWIDDHQIARVNVCGKPYSKAFINSAIGMTVTAIATLGITMVGNA